MQEVMASGGALKPSDGWGEPVVSTGFISTLGFSAPSMAGGLGSTCTLGDCAQAIAREIRNDLYIAGAPMRPGRYGWSYCVFHTTTKLMNEEGSSPVLRVLLLTMIIVASSLASASSPRPERITLSVSELERAMNGEVVVHQRDTEGVALAAVAFVRAPPEAVLSAVIDFPPRVAEIDNLVGVEPYSVGGQPAGRWTVDLTFRLINFYVIYQCQMEEYWCSFGLDESEDSDIDFAEGAYSITESDGGSWLEYHSRSIPPPFIPASIRASRRASSTTQMLMGIKNRAEGGT